MEDRAAHEPDDEGKSEREHQHAGYGEKHEPGRARGGLREPEKGNRYGLVGNACRRRIRDHETGEER